MSAPAHPSTCACLPCCDSDMLRRNPIHEAEREESRDAQRYSRELEGCYRHAWRDDGAGGGVCTGCGATVSAGEL